MYPKTYLRWRETIYVNLLSKKLAYPYDHMNSLEKYNEEQLPSKENFYNLLNDEHVIDGKYHYAQKI